MASSLVNSVVHWRKKLERNTEEDVILNVIHKLSKVPMTSDLLQETGIGKTIRSLAKKEGKVGVKASVVLNHWREVLLSSASVPENGKHKSKTNCENDKKSEKSSKKSSFESSPTKTKKDHTSSKHNQIASNGIAKPIVKSDRTDQTHHVNGFATHKVQHVKENGHEKILKQSTPETKRKITEVSSPQNDVKVKKHKLENGIEKTSSHDLTKKKSHVNDSHVKTENGTEKTSNHDVSKKKTHVNGSHVKAENGIEKPSSHDVSKKKTHVNGSHVKAENGIEKTSSHDLSKKKSHVNGSHFKEENGIKKTSSHDVSEKKSHVNGSPVVSKESSSKTHSHKHSKKSSESESPKKSKKNKEVEDSSKVGLKAGATEAFTASEALFEDCLNFSDVVKVKKKKSSKSSTEKKIKEKSVKKENSGENHKYRPSTSSAPSLSVSSASSSKSSKSSKASGATLPAPLSQPLRNSLPQINEVDILSTLPQPLPNYRPLPPRHDDSHDSHARRKVLSNEDAIKFTSSRRERTNVYSGRRTGFFHTEVPSLFDSCIRILIDNIKDIEYIGGAPYFLLKPVLERANPAQLENIEHYNPYLIDETHELWEIHTRREFKNLEPGENDTWRELYWRAFDERNSRLKTLTKNISENFSRSKPGRSVKLAYVHSAAKPPRDVARRQAKNGTGLPVNHPVRPGPPSKATPRPTAPAINAPSTSTGRETPHVVPKKPKIAPLMAKTLKSMKQCFRR